MYTYLYIIISIHLVKMQYINYIYTSRNNPNNIKESRRGKWKKQNTTIKIADLNPSISTLSLNENVPNTAIKSITTRMDDKRRDPIICSLKKSNLNK